MYTSLDISEAVADMVRYPLFPLTGNPLEEKHSLEGDWRDKAIARLPKLKKLDGVPVVSQEGDEEG